MVSDSRASVHVNWCITTILFLQMTVEKANKRQKNVHQILKARFNAWNESISICEQCMVHVPECAEFSFAWQVILQDFKQPVICVGA